MCPNGTPTLTRSGVEKWVGSSAFKLTDSAEGFQLMVASSEELTEASQEVSSPLEKDPEPGKRSLPGSFTGVLTS